MNMTSQRGKQLPTIRHFFKVLTSGCFTKLSLPQAFCRQLHEDYSEEAILTSRQGSWHVKSGQCSEGNIYLENGWDNFVQEHKLNIGDFLVFEHRGHMLFDVLMFCPSACEKEIHLQLDNEKMITPAIVSGKQHVMRNIRQSSLKTALAYVAKRKEKPTCSGVLRKSKICNLIPACKKTPAYEPKNPYFQTIINTSNGGRYSYMAIPSRFVKSNGLAEQCSLTLRDPSRKLWPIQLKSRQGSAVSTRRLSMGHGFKQFYVANKLKRGDICIFELSCSPKRSGTVLMDVHIFPKLM